MAEQIDKEQIDEAFKLAKDFESKYWNSELPDYMNLIEDLRLSNNIHETAHSRVLYKLLCSGKCHSYPLLRIFLEIVGFKDVEIKDTDNVKLFVEKENIDLLIKIGDKVIILENKVNHAKDQERQIIRYYNKVKNGEIKEINNIDDNKIYVRYLTRSESDSEPDKKSLSDENGQINMNNYKKISYEKEIREWISECKKGWKSELINSALIQYGDFIENMFEPNKKRIKAMNNFINKMFDIETKAVDEKYSIIRRKMTEISEAQKTLDTFERMLNDYTINYIADNVEKELKTVYGIKSKVIKIINNEELDFAVKYKSKLYKGVARFSEDKKEGKLWFGLRTKNGYLVSWEDSEPQSEIKIPKEQMEKVRLILECDKIATYDSNNDECEDYKTLYEDYREDDGKEYAYWKYCNYKEKAIEKMIEEIKEYIDVIKNLK